MAQSETNSRSSGYPAGYSPPSVSGVAANGAAQQAHPSAPTSQAQTDTQAGANMQPLNLPPIRAGDEGQQAQQQSHPPPQQQQQAQQPQSQLHPGQPPAPSMQYYLAPGQPYPAGPPDPSQHMRYPIPPADSRIMSGGRHKKEIKRRTKTGCLTCRKRRIKVCLHPFLWCAKPSRRG